MVIRHKGAKMKVVEAMVAELRAGDRLRDRAGRLWHVRAKADGAVVCRCWRRGRQRWSYEVFHPEEFLAGRVWRTEAAE